jgi:hypothetical protein
LRAIAEMNYLETTEARRDALAAHLGAQLAQRI